MILDGGSTDNSVKIINEYEKHLSFWCSEPDGGQAAAINRAFSMATGDILGWLNSDDCLKGITGKELNQMLDVVTPPV